MFNDESGQGMLDKVQISIPESWKLDIYVCRHNIFNTSFCRFQFLHSIQISKNLCIILLKIVMNILLRKKIKFFSKIKKAVNIK